MNNKKSILDILGPVMVGPSSSHTAGAVRLGLLAGKIFGSEPKNITFNLYNSYAKTGHGHGTQTALLAGVLGYNVESDKIKSAFDIAKDKNINLTFNYFEDYNRHPNSVDFIMENNDGLVLNIQGASLGAGEILIDKINDFSFNLKGDYPTLLLMYKDVKGMIYKVTSLISNANVNIASMNCDRSAKGKGASMGICLDSYLPVNVFEELVKIDDIYLIRLIGKL